MEKSLALALERWEGITHPIVQEAYDNVPNDKRFDPRMHGSCAKAEDLSKEAEKQMLPIWKSLEN